MVRRVGPGAKFLSVGDRVVVVAPGKYRNIDIVPEFACAKLLPTEDFESLSTLPLVFTTAIYALKFLANLRPGESVLIHSACGRCGIGGNPGGQMAWGDNFRHSWHSGQARVALAELRHSNFANL